MNTPPSTMAAKYDEAFLNRTPRLCIYKDVDSCMHHGWDYYVPFCRDEHDSNVWRIYVGNNSVRILTLDEMPDEVRETLAMVLVRFAKHPKRFPALSLEVNLSSAVIPPIHLPERLPVMDDMRDIGWRVYTDCYVLVLHEKILGKLRGIS